MPRGSAITHTVVISSLSFGLVVSGSAIALLLRTKYNRRNTDQSTTCAQTLDVIFFGDTCLPLFRLISRLSCGLACSIRSRLIATLTIIPGARRERPRRSFGASVGRISSVHVLYVLRGCSEDELLLSLCSL